MFRRYWILVCFWQPEGCALWRHWPSCAGGTVEVCPVVRVESRNRLLKPRGLVSSERVGSGAASFFSVKDYYRMGGNGSAPPRRAGGTAGREDY